LAEMVYSSFPAGWVGRRQEIEVGPMSGESNVELWLGAHGFESTPERVETILRVAKASSRVLSHDEIEKVLESAGWSGPRRLARGS
ncbi:MAG TPA: 2-isopropylmalate synthase, partial [Thermoanaerobaculia bacterium]